MRSEPCSMGPLSQRRRVREHVRSHAQWGRLVGGEAEGEFPKQNLTLPARPSGLSTCSLRTLEETIRTHKSVAEPARIGPPPNPRRNPAAQLEKSKKNERQGRGPAMAPFACVQASVLLADRQADVL